MEKKIDFKSIIILILLLIIIMLLFVRCQEENDSTEVMQPQNHSAVFDIFVDVNYNQYILDEHGNVIGIKSGEEPFEINKDDSQKNGDNQGNGNGNDKENQTTGSSENGKPSGEGQTSGEKIDSGEATYPSGENSGDKSGDLASGDTKIKDKNGYEIPIYDPQDNSLDGKVYVDDKNGNFLYQQELDIFSNATFANQNKIAPGASGEYEFTVHNSSKKPIDYYIEMQETSEYHLNLKYRLKREGRFVIGDATTWVSASELITNYNTLKRGGEDQYTLEWQWMHDDEADTLAGSKMKSSYLLKVIVYFTAE